MSFRIKRGDTGPPLVVALSYSDGTFPNLSGATGRFLMRLRGEAEPRIDAEVTLDDAEKTATYAWEDEDTAEAGTYIGEIEVTLANDAVQTFPADGYLTIKVVPDLG